MEQKQKELDELEGAARAIVDMVDPPTDGDGVCWIF
jgi:hypothetical protein